MSPHRRLFILLIPLAIHLGCGEPEETPTSLTLFCGSVSEPAMEKITARFEQKTGIEVNMIFGGSGTLLSQIELTEQGEIYLPGSPDYIVNDLEARFPLHMEGRHELHEGKRIKVALWEPMIMLFAE